MQAQLSSTAQSRAANRWSELKARWNLALAITLLALGAAFLLGGAGAAGAASTLVGAANLSRWLREGPLGGRSSLRSVLRAFEMTAALVVLGICLHYFGVV